MGSNMLLLVTDVIWELAEKNHERQVKIIAPYSAPLQGSWGCERVLTILIILTRLSAYYHDESGQDKSNAGTSV